MNKVWMDLSTMEVQILAFDSPFEEASPQLAGGGIRSSDWYCTDNRTHSVVVEQCWCIWRGLFAGILGLSSYRPASHKGWDPMVRDHAGDE